MQKVLAWLCSSNWRREFQLSLMALPVRVLYYKVVCQTYSFRSEMWNNSLFFSCRRRHTISVSAFLLNRSSDLDEYNYPKKKGIKDECSRLLEASTMKSRRGFAIQRLMNAMRQAHADGWFIVFDTLTLADDRLEAFYDNPNALRDYFRDIGR